MVYKNKKKGQSSQATMIAVLLIAMLGGIFALGDFTGGEEDDKKDVVDIPDNENVIDEEGVAYLERDEEYISALVSNQTGEDKGVLILTNDCVDDECEYENYYDNTSTTYDLKDLTEYTGDLYSRDTIERIWFNTETQVSGFNNYFQAFLIYNTNWDKYRLIYSVEDDVLVIPQLEEVNIEDLDVSSFDVFQVNSIYRSVQGIFDELEEKDAKFFIVKGVSGNDDIKASSITSLVIVVEDEIHVVKQFRWDSQDDTNQQNTHFLSINNVDISAEQYRNNLGHWTAPAQVKTDMSFAVSDNEQFSYDRIAVNSDTRTTGFDVVSVTKQEMTEIGLMDEQQAKILAKDKFENVIESGVGNRAYTSFSDVNLNDLLSDFQDNAISLWTDTINHNAYGIGVAESEDFDFTDGFVIDGYFSNQEGVTALEVGSYEFDNEDSKGLVMNDEGLVEIQGSQIVGENYGVFTFAEENSSLYFRGTAYVVDEIEEGESLVKLWDRVYSGMINLFDYSFDYGLWITQQATNGKFSPVDVYDECGLSGCSYGYVTTFTNSESTTATLVTEKPISNLLSYGDKDYWSFWKLEKRSGAQTINGCIIMDMPTNNLGRVPVSICDDEIVGMNSFAQFKILGTQEE